MSIELTADLWCLPSFGVGEVMMTSKAAAGLGMTAARVAMIFMGLVDLMVSLVVLVL